MSAPIDHAGKIYGCLSVIGKAPSVVSPSGTTIAVWNVKCLCGHEKTMRAQNLIGKKHVSCGHEKCSQKWGALTIVTCEDCGCDYEIKRRSGRSKSRCKKCSAKLAAKSKSGSPASNRLPNGKGGLNLLIGAYKKRAKEKDRPFSLTDDDFSRITKSNCHYCGKPPSQSIKSKKGSAEPYVYNGIDRVDSSKGYEVGNSVACCSVCNYMKQDLGIDEFLSHVAAIYRHAIPPKSGNRVFLP